MRLKGKVAMVTGGGRGIGAAIVRRLAAEGADVALTYVQNERKAEASVEAVRTAGRRGVAIKADNLDGKSVVAAVHRAAEELGGLDILVNNAGIFPFGPPEEVTEEEIDRTLAIHVRSVYLACQAALGHLGDGGRIISIGSCFGERVPYAGLALYAMSKSAITGLTRGLARDLGPRGITVNSINPGSTNTEANPEDGPQADLERKLMAIGRYGQPEDIAAMVALIASEEGRFISGATIAVDGGYNA